MVHRKNEWQLSESEKQGESLAIRAIREGQVPGIHEVIYESDFDTLSIRHSAKDRRGFASGAVLAAEFIHNKKGIYTMKDVLEL